MGKAPILQPSPGATQGHCACPICAITGLAAAAAAPKKGKIKMKGSRCEVHPSASQLREVCED